MRIALAFVLIWFLFDRIAAALGSTSGEAGILVCAIVLALRANAAWLALGMFAQGGIAEETLFRGFMYRHLRRTREFSRAAGLSAIPFAVAHLPILWLLDVRVALLALLMAVTWAFPLAWLFDRAGGSIWPGAILHAAMQGAIKLVATDDPNFTKLAIAWVALGLFAPWLLFFVRAKASQ